MRLIDADVFYASIDDICKAEGSMAPITIAVRSFIKRQIDIQQTILAGSEEIIHCRDCKWWDKGDDTSVNKRCRSAKHGYMSRNWDIDIARKYPGSFYCADGERADEDDRDYC